MNKTSNKTRIALDKTPITCYNTDMLRDNNNTKENKMDKFDIEIAKRNLTGMVKVSFRDGMTMYVNVSDVVLLANHRVRVGTHRCAVSRIRSIKDGSGIYAK